MSAASVRESGVTVRGSILTGPEPSANPPKHRRRAVRAVRASLRARAFHRKRAHTTHKPQDREERTLASLTLKPGALRHSSLVPWDGRTLLAAIDAWQ